MAYVTPVTDRTQADVSSQTAKAYFEVADWNRVYGNSIVLYNIVVSAGGSITFDTVGVPTTATVPTKTELNDMLSNINNIRTWVNANLIVPSDTRNVALNEAWGEGQAALAANFLDVNRWEALIDFLKEELDQ